MCMDQVISSKNVQHKHPVTTRPRGERVNMLKKRMNSLQLAGDGKGGGDLQDYFTASQFEANSPFR